MLRVLALSFSWLEVAGGGGRYETMGNPQMGRTELPRALHSRCRVPEALGVCVINGRVQLLLQG